ncbi:hypothetical protein FSP39_015550 [Pinctada imbricata]|uniref:Uncharacterized protein n=1 Tax=Pinctada imbricata TaxID=66713 RepID=A0AA88Y727_PINIB|nr:hypothetical protein FSP39_015550 [Pinctada imbricata]
MATKAEIEVRLENFVKSKTAEEIYLDLSEPSKVIIRHKSKRGSITLATFWINVLQSRNNYPVQLYPYRTLYDKNGHYKVVLRVDDVSITVFLSNGTLMIQGDFVLDWFIRRFSQIMTAFDSPPQDPQPVSDGYDEHKKNWTAFIDKEQARKGSLTKAELLKERQKEEASIILTNEVEEEKQDSELAEKTELEELEVDITEDPELFNLEKWTGDVLQRQLDYLLLPAVKDGPTYIYKLWKSLLDLWLENPENKVYIATPRLDVQRLGDVCQLVLNHRVTSNIDAFYVRILCDQNLSISDVKKAAQGKFISKEQVIIEYRLYNRMVYPQVPFHCSFIACVNEEGHAKVLTTTANFHRDHFGKSNSETVEYCTMSQSRFIQRFLKPLNSSLVM